MGVIRALLLKEEFVTHQLGTETTERDIVKV